MTTLKAPSTRVIYKMQEMLQSLLVSVTNPVSPSLSFSLTLFLSLSSFSCYNYSTILSPTDGLAVDWVNDRLYFSYNDPDSSLNRPNRLAYYDLTTGEETEITSTIYQQELAIKPRSPFTLFFDIAVDPVNQ